MSQVVICLILFLYTRVSNALECKITHTTENDTIQFFIENNEEGNITATFDIILFNLKSDVVFPFTNTIKSCEKKRVFKLTPVDTNKKYNYILTNYYAIGSNKAIHDDSFLYSLPFYTNRVFSISQGYNGKFSHFGRDKYSIDWLMPEGTMVLATRSGKVVGIKDDSNVGGNDKKYKDLANYILIQHSDDTIGIYNHLLYHGVKVKIGQIINAGDIIGLSGNTGYTSGPHLHFNVFKTIDGKDRESIPINTYYIENVNNTNFFNRRRN